MPELPDVEIFRREVAEDAVGDVITSISINAPKMIRFITPKDFLISLTGQKITATKRHGKNLFLKTKTGAFLRIHFGMTGYLEYQEDSGKLPSHTCLCLHLSSGSRLVYIDARKFGAIEFIDNFDDFLHKAHIGPDIETLKATEFENLIRKRHGQLKPVLMDQSLMSGLGNVYTDEVLFQAKIHPETLVDELKSKDIHVIYKKMKAIIKEAIKDNGVRDKMPVKFLIQHRHKGERCPQCRKGVIEMKTVGGRSTYFCAFCQKPH